MRSLSFMARGESRKRCRLFEFFNTMTKILGPKGVILFSTIIYFKTMRDVTLGYVIIIPS